MVVVNNAALNIETHVFFQIIVLSGYIYIYIYTHSEVEFLGHMVVLLLVWGTSILFSTVAVPVCIPINRVQEKELKKNLQIFIKFCDNNEIIKIFVSKSWNKW